MITSAPKTVIQRLVDFREGEMRVAVWSCAYFFLLLSSYYVLRPVRDAMGLTGGVRDLSKLFLVTLGAMLVLSPLFAALVSRHSRRVFIPVTYAFFSLNLSLFYLLFQVVPEQHSIWLARAFYVWVSVFNLFVVSIFWSMMADCFTVEQGKRLFGFIAVGGSIGAVIGSGTTAALAQVIGEVNLLPFSYVLLLAACACVKRVDSLMAVRQANTKEDTSAAHDAPGNVRSDRIIRGHPFAGLTRILQSPYLLGICLYLFMYPFSSTIVYFTQGSIVDEFFPDRSQQTTVFGLIDMGTNLVTVLIQVFLTGRVIRFIGVGFTLGLLPIVTLLGLILLGLMLAVQPVMSGIGLFGLAQTLTMVVLVGFQICRRASNYALSRPARESLFTVVSREDKYKAKNLIDTFVYRGADVAGERAFTVLTGKAVGFGLSQVLWLAAPLMAVWFVIAVLLGRRQAVIAARTGTTPVAASSRLDSDEPGDQVAD